MNNWHYRSELYKVAKFLLVKVTMCMLLTNVHLVPSVVLRGKELLAKVRMDINT